MELRLKFWNGKKRVWEERVYYCVSEVNIGSKKGYESRDKILINGIELKV